MLFTKRGTSIHHLLPGLKQALGPGCVVIYPGANGTEDLL